MEQSNGALQLEDQDSSELMWIRDKFLNHDGEYFFDGRQVKVIHGHSPVDKPDVRHNRICIDTGAYYSGLLTAVALDGQSERFIIADANQ